MARLPPAHLPVLSAPAVLVGTAGTGYTGTAGVQERPRDSWYGPAREHRVAFASSSYRSA